MHLLSNSWIDRKGKSILNILVKCPKGAMFIKSIDASTYVKDAQLSCEMLDNFIQEIDVQYVVQAIMDNAANYVVVGHCLCKVIHACIGLLVSPIAMVLC